MLIAITTYQQSLEDVLIFLFFGIGAKVIILFVRRSKKPQVPRGRTRLWYGLGIFWTLSAILQLWPTMAVASAQSLRPHPLLWSLASYWSAHAMANTIWSVVIQLILGILLLTERENVTGRIALGISAVWSLFLWTAGEDWGGLTHVSASLALGSPGAGFLALAASAALLMPVSLWENGKIPQFMFRGIAILWGIGTVWQFVHFNAYAAWAPVWVPYIDPAQPGLTLLLLHGEQALFRGHTLLVNLALSLLMAVGEVLLIRRPAGGIFWTVVGLNLLAFWWLGQGLGFRPAYGASLNAAPLVFLMIWSSSSATTRHRQTRQADTPALSA